MMLFNIRGVIIRRDGLDKFVRIVAQVDHPDIYRSIERKANRPITKELILQQATGHFGIPPENIVWPHHIEVNDL